MSEMSEGAKAAWERLIEGKRQQVIFDWSKEQVYAAGFADALAAVERYKTHLLERADEFERVGDHHSAHAFHNFASEVRNTEMWIKENITCNLPDHQRCQEANKR